MIKLTFPVNYIGLTQAYKSSHKAIDMGWNKSYGGPNHDIIAPEDGKVTYVKNNYNTTDKTGSSYGNYIRIDHGNGISTLMAHLKYNSVTVKVGDIVKRGQKLGTMGNTGHSTGVHLHYEVRINNDRVEPLKYTYATKNQIVSTNTKNKYNIMYLNEEDLMEENKVGIESNDENILFEYICNKTGMYKIQLNNNEKLIIKEANE